MVTIGAAVQEVFIIFYIYSTITLLIHTVCHCLYILLCTTDCTLLPSGVAILDLNYFQLRVARILKRSREVTR